MQVDGGAYLKNFLVVVFCMYVSVPQKSRKDPVSLEEIRNSTNLAILSFLHRGGWALGNESTDPHYHPLWWAVLEWVENYLLVIEHDLNYTSFVVSVLFHKPEGEDGRGRYFVGVRYLWPLFEGGGGTYAMGGTNSRNLRSFKISILFFLPFAYFPKHLLTARILSLFAAVAISSLYVHFCYSICPTF